jgi:hypothetical protein
MRNRRHSEIAAAIAAYNDSDRDMLLPPAAAGLLTAVFAHADVSRLPTAPAAGEVMKPSPILLRCCCRSPCITTKREPVFKPRLAPIA